MKPLLITTRIIFVGIFWSIFFLEGIRVIMLKNWRFDIVRPSHWQYAWDLWLSGWVINDAKEWAFVLIILTFVPLWLTGWAALSLLPWENYFIKAAFFPWEIIKKLFFQPVKVLASTTGIKRVKKKKSYKEIRPKSIRAPADENIYKMQNTSAKPLNAGSTVIPVMTPPMSPSRSTSSTISEEPKESKFDHSLFKFDEEDDFDFDFDAFDNDKKTKETTAPAKATTDTEVQAAPKDNKNNKEKEKNKTNKENNKNAKAPKSVDVSPPTSTQNQPPRTNGNSTLDVIKQKGYEVINGTTIKNNFVDFIGVAENQLFLCIIDKEPGDWLADEERFNDEEPLWFSESSHRISPVRKADISRQTLTDKLESADLHFEIKAYIVVPIGNIINAEDMFEIWDDIGAKVTRIDRGTPKELHLFSKALDEAIDSINKDKFEKVKKIVRGLA